ncbi:hypothetical protein LTR70_007185 [Exophiala xenobiotica]|uniref:Uncharacterized protein n=1 Tax=Lithohypha guttulata TaxID=1690604 RepID=A0ABR0JTW7_9EURO|nr:hypothetical protein LTR24_010452 [Lithohypha guttulata]KAK5314470.1 hypothetical protein LTR70_007185 [Exophiala xenobiotica]
MDARSALAGTTQLSVHCSQCNCNITKWVSQVKNVNSEVTSFKDSLLALQLSYDRLDASLKDNTILDAARTTDHYAGGNLWSQLSVALNDCQNIILALRQILQNIEYVSRRVSSILKHLAEALAVGELVLTKNAVKLLEQNISFPVAMINLTLALQQPYLHETAHTNTLRNLTALKSGHDIFSSNLRGLLRLSQSPEHKVFQNMNSFSNTVSVFIDNAAASLSEASAATALLTAVDIHHEDDIPSAEQNVWRQEDASTLHTTEYDEELAGGSLISGRSSSMPIQDLESNSQCGTSEHDDEIELELTMEYMANGQADLEIEDYAGAEENFRRALEMAEENDFRKRLDYGPGDITLMLADCLMQQEKEEEALEILEPLADGTASFIRSDDASSQAANTNEGLEQGLQFKASHILAMVFLKRRDFQAAEKRAKEAFKGRRRLLGAQNPMTVESVRLVIDIYTAKDDKINARAYRRFLEPPAKSRRSAGSVSSQATPGSQPAATNHASDAHGTFVPASKLETSSQKSATPDSSLPSGTANVHAAAPIERAPPQTDQAAPTVPQARETVKTAHLPQASSQPLSEDPQGIPLLFAQANNARSPPLASPKTSSTSLPRFSLSHNTVLTQIAEHETIKTAGSKVETEIHGMPSASPTPDIEPDPLPPNIGVTSTASRKKLSWSNPFSRTSATKADSNVVKKRDEDSSRTVTEGTSRNSSVTSVNFPDQKRHMSMADSFSFGARSFYGKIDDYGDAKESRPSIASRSLSVSTHPPARTRQELGPRFSAVRMLRQEGNKSAAVDSAMRLLKEYDPDRKVLMVREAELKKNMKESHKGMAGTGNGYAPIHFFCERKVEANIEVELLIEQGVDVNAVACKAGLPGTDPFTPLQRAIEYGHAEIVRLLVEADVAIAPPKSQKGPSNKDQLNQPLLLACTKGHTEITFVLLQAGAAKLLKEFPQRQWHGNSLLHEACWLANTDIVKMLLDYSKVLKEQHRQSTSGQPDYESGIIGSPGQQDQFGTTPIMYAVDLRDCTNDRMRALKTSKRKECLRLLLEHAVHGDLHSHTYRESVARMLSLKWVKGPGAGHSIFCYADEAGDDELNRLLDPFRYQVSPGMRCSARPQCSATLRSNVLSSGSVRSEQGPARTVRLPSFPELMSTPVEFPRDGGSMRREGPPPSSESAAGSMSPSSTSFGHERSVSMSLTSATGSVVGSDGGANFS